MWQYFIFDHIFSFLDTIYIVRSLYYEHNKVYILLDIPYLVKQNINFIKNNDSGLKM